MGGKEEEAAGHSISAKTLRENLTVIKGSAKDVDADYDNLGLH